MGEEDQNIIDFYTTIHRIDILYGANSHALFPCQICKKIDCRGASKKCKGEGAWRYGISTKG